MSMNKKKNFIFTLFNSGEHVGRDTHLITYAACLDNDKFFSFEYNFTSDAANHNISMSEKLAEGITDISSITITTRFYYVLNS